MVLQEIYEKLKMEHAASITKHGKWAGRISEERQAKAIQGEYTEWYEAYTLSDVHGEHGEIEELIDLMNVCAKRIMFLSGEDI